MQWLEFDFGDVYEISRYVIRDAGANGLSHDLNTRHLLEQSEGQYWEFDVELIPRSDNPG
jgi:hypothetical protein